MSHRPRGRAAVPRAGPRAWSLASLAILVSFGLVVACARPRAAPRPLDEGEALARVRATRVPAHPEAPLGLADAAALLHEHNPEVRAARAVFRSAQARASVRTPGPNPTIDLGPLLFGPSLLESVRVGVDAALGFRVLLADTRALADHASRVAAEAARAEAGAVEREQYLALRGEYVAVGVLVEVAAARRGLADAADRAVESAGQAVDAGAATTLDVALLRLEAAETRADLWDAEASIAEARGALGRRLGVGGAGTPHGPTEVPRLPGAVPDADALTRVALAHHPALVRLRAAYLLAEAQLRLEVARAWPELGAGVTYEEDDGGKLGLPLSIEVPILDRNQVGIAEARARRAEVRERFEAALAGVLADVDRARSVVEARSRRLALYDDALARATETDAIARSVLERTGAFEMLRYLEVLRSTRRARVTHLTSRRDLYAAWSALEEAVGAPLLRFETEPGRSSMGPGEHGGEEPR